MIIDRIENFSLYKNSVDGLSEAIIFAEKVKNENIPQGKYSFQNGFALVQEGNTHKFEDADFESHRKYLDIQILLSGSEYVEYANKRYLSEKVPFDSEKDLELLEGNGSKILIKKDTFYVLYPEDAHKPCCHYDIPTQYKKVLIKVEL